MTTIRKLLSESRSSSCLLKSSRLKISKRRVYCTKTRLHATFKAESHSPLYFCRFLFDFTEFVSNTVERIQCQTQALCDASLKSFPMVAVAFDLLAAAIRSWLKTTSAAAAAAAAAAKALAPAAVMRRRQVARAKTISGAQWTSFNELAKLISCYVWMISTTEPLIRDVLSDCECFWCSMVNELNAIMPFIF